MAPSALGPRALSVHVSVEVGGLIGQFHSCTGHTCALFQSAIRNLVNQLQNRMDDRKGKGRKCNWWRGKVRTRWISHVDDRCQRVPLFLSTLFTFKSHLVCCDFWQPNSCTSFSCLRSKKKISVQFTALVSTGICERVLDCQSRWGMQSMLMPRFAVTVDCQQSLYQCVFKCITEIPVASESVHKRSSAAQHSQSLASVLTASTNLSS